MSLKAKIEAVIYASEEPVTLSQLVGLLGGEAQAELDAFESQQASLALDDSQPLELDSGDQDALNAETLGEAEAETATDTDAATSEPEAGVEPVQAAESEDEPIPATSESIAEVSTEAASEAPAGPESATIDEKSMAREATAAAKMRERRLREYFRSILDRLIAEYANSDRGLEVREIAGGFRLATKPEYHDAVRGFVKSLKPPLKLSLQALEALAVVAYKQPVTAPEISEIRGVESGGVLGSLMTRKLIATAGRKQVIGRPILYKTTKEFLLRFGLKDINELPSIEEFEKLAGEFAESEPVQEEIRMDGPQSSSREAADSGGSHALDEINAAPEPTSTLHDSVEDMMADKSYSPEGSKREPAYHYEDRAAEAARAAEVELEAGHHEPQADGDDRPADIADDTVIDGRISGLDPRDNTDDNPSAEEAAEQEKEGLKVSNYNVTFPLMASDSDEDDDTVATPEGDNEFAPDQPLPASTAVPERPRGNEPHPGQPIRPAQE